MRIVSLLVTAAAVAALLGGCTAVPRAATTTAPSRSATPAPTAHGATAPRPFLALGCDEIAPPASLAPLLRESVTRSTLPAAASLQSSAGPLGYAVRQNGGVDCLWANSAPRFAGGGNSSNPDWTAFAVASMPATAADYETAGGSGQAEVSCSVGGPSGFCSGDHFANGTWTTFEVAGALIRSGDSDDSLTARWAPVIAAIAARIDAAPRRTVVPASAASIALPTGCEAIVPGAAIASAIGDASPEPAQQDGGGWSLEAQAWADLDAMPCGWSVVDDAVRMTFLADGAWAWDAAAPTGTAIELPAGAGGDHAVWAVDQKDSSGDWTHLDLRVGGNWIRVSEAQYPAFHPETAYPAIAAAIESSLRH